ncbi:MAG TPA: NUDIX domain-containing protein [Blastocatellia bacterium]|nr:NUDIX domain-containing protein [Blastocatellia bacterium]
MPTKLEISAGGVVFRERDHGIDVALISVGEDHRWQLPKGLVDKRESTEAAALREVREEAGVDGEVISKIDKVEYWYYSKGATKRAHIHKFVYFYLLRYKSGDVAGHDDEVNEARWVEINDAIGMLEFGSERRIVERAREMIAALPVDAMRADEPEQRTE